MARKSLAKCESIFLDSGVLIDLLKVDVSKSTIQVQERIKQVNTFFNSLSGIKNGWAFQMSAITISEIFHLDKQHNDLLGAIANILQSSELEILALDESAALFHNSEFYSFLSNKNIEELRKEVCYPANKYANIRDRIRRDILIASTAKQYNSDIVLTTDGGFRDLCTRLGVDCHLFTGDINDFCTNGDGSKIYDFI